MTITAREMREKYRIRARKAGIEVPDWCPEKFIVEFCDCALAHGEERAASHIRKLKKEDELIDFSRRVSQS